MYDIQPKQQQQIKLVQTFPQEHPSSHWISYLLQINPNTIVSASASSNFSYSSDNVIVIWSKCNTTAQYEPIQRIKRKKAGGYTNSLVLINQKKEEEEDEFASCSWDDHFIIIWGRGKGDKEMFKIKQKIENVNRVYRLLYISLKNELIFGSPYSPSYLQIWSPSSSSDFIERQKIQTSSHIVSLCQINRNDDSKSRRIEFASGHENGQIMIWSKQQQINYSLCKTLKPFNDWVWDLIFINGEFNCLIACCYKENKIKIFKEGEEEGEEELEHKEVVGLIPMSNGQFASGGNDHCLKIWSPSFSSSP